MIEEFERHLRGTNLSENTKSSYLFAVRQYNDQYGEVSQKNLRAYKVWLIENYKPKTVNLRLRAINCYLESVGKEKWKLPFVQQKAFLENVISEADYEYFKNYLKRDNELFWYFVIRFLAATGARVSELIQIKVEHIKLGHLDLYSKGGKLRRIYIPKALQDEALSWLAEKQQESGFIFLNKYGERITTRGISGQLKKLAVRYEIDPVVVYPHSFRHRFAKSFLERCSDIAFLADIMGHESIETTRIYLRKICKRVPSVLKVRVAILNTITIRKDTLNHINNTILFLYGWYDYKSFGNVSHDPILVSNATRAFFCLLLYQW